MYGNKVEIYRYKVEFSAPVTASDENGEVCVSEVPTAEYAVSEAHKYDIIAALGEREYAVTEIDQTGNEWIDGMEFGSCDLAKEALELGEEEYRASIPVTTDETLANLIFELVSGGVI